jgi:hypothetical protein
MATRGGWYGGLVIACALAVVGVLLALPAPRRGVPAPAPPTVPTLASVWPRARPFPIPGFLPDGSGYQPYRILDPGGSVGVATEPGKVRTTLVLVTGERAVPLQTRDSGLYQGVGATSDRLFWMLTAPDPAGQPSVGLWTAPRTGGPATPLTTDVGLPMLLGSAYDISAVGDRLYWTSTRPGTDQTELRSIPVNGGQVRVEWIPGVWTLSRWPWLVSPPGEASTRLRSLTTGSTITAVGPVPCSPVWCRLIPDGTGGRTVLVHPDGSDRREVGAPGALPVGADVAARDRFEPLLVPAAAAGGIGARLELYDLSTGRTVLVAPNVSNAKGDATHLWWSTGDNETLSWWGLDLAMLG